MPDDTLRMTPKRAAVLAAVRAAESHPCADEVLRMVQSEVPGIGVATVYRTLDLLVRHGQLLQLRLSDEAVVRYDANTHPHQHVICDLCGRVFDIDLALPDRVVDDAARRSGVHITQYDLRLRGTCAACRS